MGRKGTKGVVPTRDGDGDGMNVLMLAAYYGHYKILENIIEHIDDYMSQDEKLEYVNKLNKRHGLSALSYAIL